MWFVLLYVITVSSSAYTEIENNYYEFVADRYLSMYAGTKNVKSIYSLTSFLTESLIMDKLLNEKSFSAKPLGILTRTSKFVLFDLPFAWISAVFQHEYFGHGNLLRKLGISVRYKFYNPPPYGLSGARIEIDDYNGYNRLSQEEWRYSLTNGVESTQFLSREIQKDFYIKENVSYTDLLLYGISKLDISGYIYITNRFIDYGDINYFIDEFSSSRMSSDELYNNLQLGALWNIIDPTLWISGYNEIIYLLYGERNFKIPMFKLGEIYFIPATRFSLTPIGYEYYLEFMLLYNKNLWSSYFRKGRGSYYFYYGSGIGIDNIILTEKIILGANMDVWNQEASSGINFNLDCKFYFSKYIGLTGSIGYKGLGYLMGRPYERGVYGYAGIAIGF